MRAGAWFRWLFAHTLGATLGAAITVSTFVPALGPLIGLGLGLGQWRGLRRELWRDGELDGIGSAIGWVVVTTIGALIPGSLLLFALALGATGGGKSPVDHSAYLLEITKAGALFAAVPGLIAGAVVGMSQGGLLRRIRATVSIRQVVAWAVATALGWGASWGLQGGALGFFALILTSPSVRATATPFQTVVAVLALLLSWMVTGALTGTVLARLPAPSWPYGA